MSYSTNQVIVADTATSIVSANNDRIKVRIKNLGATTVFLGSNNSVTTSNGMVLLAGKEFVDSSSLTEWFGIVSSGTVNVCVEEQDLSGVN
jgi:hypothetical protein